MTVKKGILEPAKALANAIYLAPTAKRVEKMLSSVPEGLQTVLYLTAPGISVV